jgi:hypothetical protein
VLQPAVDEESEGRLQEEFQKAVLQWETYQGMDENRLITVTCSLGGVVRKWTLAHARTNAKRARPQAAGSFRRKNGCAG